MASNGSRYAQEDDAVRTAAEQVAIDADRDAAVAAPSAWRAQPGVHFDYGDNLFRAARRLRYHRQPDDPLYRQLWVYTSDPIRSDYRGAVQILKIPYEPLEPGPAGLTLAVDDYEEAGGFRYPGVDLDDPRTLMSQGRAPAPGDIFFHQQMVYAVCCEVIARFTVALGRDPTWGFPPNDPRDRLRIRPHFREESNAYYDMNSGELRFGYFPAHPQSGPRTLPQGIVYTCLSYDVIAHEVTHALLDGMRRRFDEPTNPDVLAFHEAFADIVATLQHFSQPESVRLALERGAGSLQDKTIFSIAEQFGQAVGRGGPLRSLLDRQGEMLTYPNAGREPHELGSVLVSAIMSALVTVFHRQAAPLRSIYLAGNASPAILHPDYLGLLAEQATKVAGRLLSLCIRAIDYCPPVDITFGEYLRALITADRDLVADDRLGYRDALISAFGQHQIFPSDVADLSEQSLLWNRPATPMPMLGRGDLRLLADPEWEMDDAEIRRHADALGELISDPRYRREFGLSDEVGQLPVIESIRATRRVGPDRQLRLGLVAEVLQQATLRVDGRSIQVHGGATVIFGVDGEARYVIRKRVKHDERARSQATFQRSREGRRQLRALKQGCGCIAVSESHPEPSKGG
jgi:hypothetical protein